MPKRQPPPIASELLTEDEFCAMVRMTRTTAARQRRAGQGPKVIRIGQQLRYRRGDIETWLASREVSA
jgi:predicted DNA-binding transcriptional regulator AlpA